MGKSTEYIFIKSAYITKTGTTISHAGFKCHTQDATFILQIQNSKYLSGKQIFVLYAYVIMYKHTRQACYNIYTMHCSYQASPCILTTQDNTT